ncbi:O-antigen ligase family protein, partial [Patescibacteria group bacterium]|nr:O-antigen ligase family protein [Patescibacteria group bacterium]
MNNLESSKTTPKPNNTILYYLSKTAFGLFLIYLFVLPFERRHIFNLDQANLDGNFVEWLSISFYGSDLILLTLIFIFTLILGIKLVKGEIIQSGIIHSRPLFGASLALIVLSLASIACLDFSGQLLGFIKLLRLMAALSIFFYIIDQVRTKKLVVLTFGALILSGIFQAGVAIFQFATQKSLQLKIFGEIDLAPEITNIAKIVVDNSRLIRPVGTLPHANVLAIFLLIAIFACLFCILYTQNSGEAVDNSTRRGIMLHVERLKQKYLNIALLICLLFITLVFVLTLSRIALACLVVDLVALVIINVKFSKKGRRNNFLKALISQLVLLAVVGLILWPLMQNRLGVQDKDGDMALSNRLHYNQEATEMIIASPFLGVGLGNSIPTLMNRSPDQETWQYQPVHNLYLLVTTEIGLLGFFIF